ncbi:hypothetical protein B566_EDAN006091 [Ephemera danica]|nr:hypothetical protein B566_EDAN006091 [Ephemera danica]
MISPELLISVLGTSPPSTVSPPPCPLRYDYKLVLKNSLLFYEAQRSGLLPLDNRIPWRSDSCFNDRGNNGEDLTGGYYTSGRKIKFTYPNAAATTVLAWGLINHEVGYAAADQLEIMREALNWGATYLARCHTGPEELYVLVGDVRRELEKFWGRPEDITDSDQRPAYAVNRTHPGTEVAAETAAALAASSMALKEYYDDGPVLSELYLAHAKGLYEFAVNCDRKEYITAVPEVGFYKSWNGVEDELVWAALWLFRVTGEERYKTEAIDMYRKFNLRKKEPEDFSWDDKVLGVQVLLSKMTLEQEYTVEVKRFCDNAVNNPNQRTPKGLFHAPSDVERAKTNPYLEFALRQVHYILGHTGRSYMIGFGINYPRKPQHSASSCPDKPAPCSQFSPENNPHILIGALVGGPDINDEYTDVRSSWKQNDVGLDYNAGFQSLVAGLMKLHGEGLLPRMAYENKTETSNNLC